jgi:hypothetical protein
MAIAKPYGTGYKDPAAVNVITALYAEATVKCIPSRVDTTAGDTIPGVYFVGKVPSNSLIRGDSTVFFSALGAGALLALGFNTGIGGASSVLLNGLSVAAAGSSTLMAAVGSFTTTKQVQPAWQLAGLSSDPGGMLDVIATITGAAPATGIVLFMLDFLKT